MVAAVEVRGVRKVFSGKVNWPIQVSEESIKAFLDDGVRSAVTKRFKEIGFTYVTLDLEGYRAGAMNEVLTRRMKTTDGA